MSRPLLDTTRAHPWHVLTGAAALGLAAGPRVPWLVVPAVALLAGALVTGRRARVACAVAVLAGAAWSGVRLDALDRPAGAVPTSDRGAVVRATLDESPRPTPFGWRALARAGARRLLLRGRGPAPGWWPGDEVRASGRLRALGDRDGWLRVRHAHGVLDARYARLTGARRGGAAGAVDTIRRRAAGALGARLPRPEAGLLRGMTLGDESRLPRAALDSLRAAGLGHIVAASGQNVALLALLVQAVGIVAGLGWRVRLALTLGLVALYVPLAGGGASIQRAGVMGAATIVAALSARPAARWHALLLAAAVTLALDPASLGQPGWQLSFAAVAAIALLGEPLSSALARRGIPRPLAAAIAITLAATAGTAPVSAAVFGTVSLTGIVANVLVAPVIAPITWLGMVASALAQPWPAGGEALAALAGPPLAFVLGVAGALDVAPARVSAPIAGCVSLALALLVAGRRARLTFTGLVHGARARDHPVPAGRRPVGPLSTFLAVATAVVVLAWPAIHVRGRAIGPPPAGVLRVSFLDVGQGDATLLQAGNGALLVDSGRPDGPILDELRQTGVSRLSALVATHAQADHLGGAAAVLRALRVGLLVDGRDGVAETHGRRMAAAAAARGVRSAAPLPGDRVRVGAMHADVLWPPPRPPGAAPIGDPNDRALVLLVSAAGVRVLLTADAESEILARLNLPVVDVLKVSHHGSADPGLPALLRRLRPRVAVIEVGAGNTYGHPVPATIAALRAAGARVLRTDRDGTVVLEARAGRLTLRSER